MGSLLEGDITYGTYPAPLAGAVRKMLLSPLAQLSSEFSGNSAGPTWAIPKVPA